jgi:two-component system, NarL family, response regulator LiaR
MTTSAPITVLVVDDSRLMRISLKSTLQCHPQHVLLLGEADNGQQALMQAERLRPNVIIMDMGMPIMDGIEATQRIQRQWPGIRVMMLTSHDSEADVLDAFRAGATSYCLKDSTPDTVLQAVQHTAMGDSWIDPRIARIVLQRQFKLSIHDSSYNNEALKSANVDTFGLDKPPFTLTDRESDVLKCITQGLNNTQIAETLYVSTNTVKTHLKNIFAKLGVEDRTTAALKAIKQRLV